MDTTKTKDEFLDFIKTEVQEEKQNKLSTFLELDSHDDEENLSVEGEGSCLTKQFRAIFNVYVTKNNIIVGLYDALDRHRLVSSGKDTGGNYTDRGTDKNSAKVMEQVLATYENYIKELKIDHLIINLIRGNLNRRSISAEKNISNLLTSWKLENVEVYSDLLVNKSRKPHGKPNRRKGGRRGRRV